MMYSIAYYQNPRKDDGNIYIITDIGNIHVITDDGIIHIITDDVGIQVKSSLMMKTYFITSNGNIMSSPTVETSCYHR